MSAVGRVLSLLDGVKRSGDGWEARCPAHDDRHASLSIATGDDGRVLLNCHAGDGCTIEAIVTSIGLTKADLFERENGGGRRIADTYDYVDEDGVLLFQVVRFDPKGFLQRRPDGRGGWVWKTAKTRKVLYRLPEVIAAVKADNTVYICEGEKDVHALEQAGSVATTSPMGAGKWRTTYGTPLKGADVVIVQDRDDEGREHAGKVAAALKDVAASVRVVEPVEGKDAADHLAAGHTIAEFTPFIADFFPSEGQREKNDVETHPVRSLSMARANVMDVVGVCFPDIIDELLACLSVASTLLLADQQNPVAINYEGPPSSLKTTLVDLFGKADDKVYRSDKFTPKSFVSHASSVARDKLDEVDLLPRIRHRLFLVPELAPLFGLRNEDLLENFSVLTRVFDGHGLSTDSGVHGQRGHVGDFLFAWIGGTTPIEYRVWKMMGKLGSRLLFFEMPNDEQSNEALVHDLTGGESYRDRVERGAVAVAEFLESLWRDTGGVRGVVWDRAEDPNDLMLRIAGYAKALARLRGTISVWREGSGDDESYNFSTPVIEGPQRAMSLLYALARGHALLHGRRQLEEADMWIVARAALKSTPNDRRAVIRLLLEDENEGAVSTADVEKALGCSAPTARAILETLDHLGVGSFLNPGPPQVGTLTLAGDLVWLLEDPAAKALKEKRRRVSRPHSSTVSIEKDPTSCESDDVNGVPYEEEPSLLDDGGSGIPAAPAEASMYDDLVAEGVDPREARVIADLGTLGRWDGEEPPF